MELMEAIMSRSSAGRLTEPGPTPQQVDLLLNAAASAPDHGRLKPWRFVSLTAVNRGDFIAAAVEAKRARMLAMSEEQMVSEREKLCRSPLIVVVGCEVQDNVKIPEIEQVVAVGAAVQNLFLAAHDMGFGVAWKTGAAAYDTAVKASVGLRARDHIVAILHLGTRAK